MKKVKKFLPALLAAFAVILILAVMVSGRNGSGDQPEATPTPSALQPSPTPVTPSPSPAQIVEQSPEPSEEVYTGPVSPLTGLPAEDDISELRPFAIMLNNLKKATPQVGIGSADIIYEIVVEGGVTRFLAVYQDPTVTGVIGSVRSARHYFIDLAQGHDAIYVHAGGSDQAYETLSARGVSRIDGVHGSDYIFYRDSARKASMGYEHSLMINTSRIHEYLGKSKIKPEHKDGFESALTFAEDGTPAGGSAAVNVKVSFSSSKTTSFEFNSDDGKYYASQYGGILKDGATGDQVSVTNVLVLYTKIYNIAGDSAGRMDAVLTGSGTGYFICGGKYTEITWSKNSASSQFEYKLKDGTPLVLGQGKSFICITANGNSVDFS